MPETLLHPAIESSRTEAVEVPWNPVRRVAFRFLFCFLTLYLLDLLGSFFQRHARHLNGDFPKPFPSSFTAGLWHHLIPWIGVHVLHLSQPVTFANDVGQDSPYQYILVATEILVSVVAMLLWTVLDHRRQDYRTLDAYLRVFVRASLCVEMLYYGVEKLIPAQFGVLSLYRLSRPLGELYPMSMLWAFMASSPGYTILCGAVEAAGGLLLLTRRTATLGALISAFAMGNVLALNIFYDVNQKIRCVYYLLLALYLLAPQLPPLWDLFVRKQPALPFVEPAIPARPWLRHTLAAVPALYALLLLSKLIPTTIYHYHASVQGELDRGKDYGVWRVTQFTMADPGKPLLTPTLAQHMHLPPGRDQWRQLILDSHRTAYLLMGNPNYDMVVAQENAAGDHLILTDEADPAWRCELTLRHPAPNALQMTGTVNGTQVQIALTRENTARMHVLDRPRWISEGRRW